jgi:hypothetical protein
MPKSEQCLRGADEAGLNTVQKKKKPHAWIAGVKGTFIRRGPHTFWLSSHLSNRRPAQYINIPATQREEILK